MMKNSLSAIFLIIGTVVGSGFISGKEIVVFFSRFGAYSFLGIFLAFFFFAFLFYIILNKGEEALQRLKSSRFSFVINLIICMIFTSAMFAGVNNLLTFDKIYINFIVLILILFVCFIIFKRGLKSLNKLNYFLIPIMLGILIMIVALKLNFSPIKFVSSLGEMSFLYSILYVILNTANSAVLIAEIGKNLNRKQKARVSIISALVLMLILLLVNIVLLQNSSSFVEDMPLISLFSGWQKVMMNIVVFIGCITTLFSLVFVSSSSMRGLCNNEFIIFSISVLMPVMLSLLGFGFMVTYFYPITSILGVFLLYDLFFKSLFKRTNQKIHSSSKDAK